MRHFRGEFLLAQRVTIKSIAHDLGISHMTVSRALSGHPNVNEETREAVLQHAQKLGYVRSAAAAAMRGEGTRIIGLLLPNIVNEFYARYANALALACDARDHQLIIHLTNDDHVLEHRALLRLQQVQADAVVYVPAPRPGGSEEIRGSGMRLIQLLRHRQETRSTQFVSLNDAVAIGDAVRHLAHGGHRNIGYIGGSEDLSSGRERLHAFRKGLIQAGLEERTDAVHTGSPTFETGRRAVGALLADEAIDAVICGGFEISNGALSGCMESTRYRGGHFSLIGYGNPSYYRWIGDGIATVDIPVEELVNGAMELLADQHPDAPTHNKVVQARFVVPGRNTGH